jgi:hypothetical protein
MSKYPHVTIIEDERICSMGQHHPGFPRMLYDALLHIRYNGDVPVFHACMSMPHSLEQCEVSVMIPINLEDPWTATVIDIKLDDTVDQTAQVALASLCGSRLADIATTPIVLFLLCFWGEPIGQKRLEAVFNHEGPQYHTGMDALAEYAQYSFDLQHNTTTTVLQQRPCMAAYEECHISTACELAQLKCENDLLSGGTVPPSKQDWELKVVYRRLSEDEHAWHYIRQQLDMSHEMVNEHTHTIIHLEHTNEQ